jgi:hypothetical protein
MTMRTIQRMLMRPPIFSCGASSSQETSLRRLEIRLDRGNTASAPLSNTSNFRLFDLLDETNRELVERLPADASGVSRVIGDLILLVSECSPEGQTLQMGQGYLVPDYPATKAVLTTGVPYAMTTDDADADPAEALVLAELGFASLLLARIAIGGAAAWGLVEIYRTEPIPFDAHAIGVAGEILARAAARAG